MLKHNIERFLVPGVFLILLLPGVKAQTGRQSDSAVFRIESATVIARGDHVPFWLYSNRRGIVSDKPFNFRLRADIHGNFNTGRLSRLDYGIDLVNRYSGHNRLFLHELYTAFSYAKIRIKGGLWEQHYGSQDAQLSSGGFIWSGNAAPIPMITIDLDDYVDIPLTAGLIDFRGGISHGWFNSNALIRNAWLHHKYLVIRVGAGHTMEFEYGLHHFAQWAGVSSRTGYGDMPDGFRAFSRIFLGMGGGSGPGTESLNAIGNHIGSHMVSLTYNGAKFSGTFYWQSIFEDGSGFWLRNYKDGLFGIRLTTPFEPVNSITAELVNTAYQSGRPDPRYIDSTHHGTGNDNYFFHGVYGGWIYKGMTIGTPLITSPNLLADHTGIRIANNRVKAFHLGVGGGLGYVGYYFLYTFTKNYATYTDPFASVRRQNCFLISTSFRDLLPYNIVFTISGAYDSGELLGQNAGFFISLKKENLIFRRKRELF